LVATTPCWLAVNPLNGASSGRYSSGALGDSLSEVVGADRNCGRQCLVDYMGQDGTPLRCGWSGVFSFA